MKEAATPVVEASRSLRGFSSLLLRRCGFSRRVDEA
jgi:hypothetical protein